jgi:hypothetical protein
MYCSRCGTETDDNAKFCPSCGLDFSTVTGATQEGSAEVDEFDAVRDALQVEWDLESELGRGGMAIVFKAHDKNLQRDVAIKVLPFSLAFDKQFVERFQREARTSAQLEHPHIIPIYRVAKSGRVIYFVMKYLRGGSLSEKLEQRGKLGIDEIRRMLAETAGALNYAHQHQIVHRDIKPDNIMFDELGHAVLTDFGIAKAATGTRLTGTGMSIGTPHYMSPEQARAQQLDGRSDVYSLGVVAYQCLTGQVPFDGEDAFSIGYKHIMEEVPTPPLATQAERELFEVIRRMMAKSPDDRFQAAEELVALLQSGRSAEEIAPRPSLAEAPTAVIRPSEVELAMRTPVTPTTPTTPIPETAPPPAPEKKKRGGILVGLFLMVFLGAGGAGGYWYFMMDAQWPLPFMQQASQPDSGDVTLDSLAAQDSLLIATGDSSEFGDSTAVEDTTAAEDTVVTPPPLPETGVLAVRNAGPGAQLSINGAGVQGLTHELPPGSVHVRVRRAGYVDFETSVQVARGDTVAVRVQWTRVEPVEPPAPVSQCEQPWTRETFNLESSCFDRPPTSNPAGPIHIIRNAAIPQRVTTSYWVEVLADGTPEGWRSTARAQDRGPFEVLALRWAQRTLTFSPATKNGRPVKGWMRVTIQGRPPQ